MTADPPKTSHPPRLEIFVDGTNFYLSRLGEGIPYRVDLNLLATRLSRGYHFAKLRYYTSPMPHYSSEAYRRQQKFFDELRRSSRIDLVLGRHEPRSDSEGRRYHVEKETDVNLAVDMVVGAYEDRFDVAMLVAGDTDYVRAIHAVQSRGKPVVWCHLPGQRHTDQLAQVCQEKYELTEKFLRTCTLGVQGR
ncbi:NYN domain-containing protein [Longimicrobium sp.]|uniref:NYN domain-containing protein n=1 Tax=Longimicrobium sp. TaxID=2029185 RepID=UPI003B3BCFB6